jgi:hypothetical protein
VHALRYRPRDGNAILGARFSPIEAAELRQHAARHNRTISEVIREAVRAVVQPSNDMLIETLRPDALPVSPRTLPREPDRTRQTLSSRFAEQEWLTEADAATMADRRSRDGRSGDGAVFLPGSPWGRSR